MSSIFQSYSNLTWLLIVMCLLCFTFGFLITNHVYCFCAPQLNAYNLDYLDMTVFKTWFAITEDPNLNFFNKRAKAGLLLSKVYNYSKAYLNSHNKGFLLVGLWILFSWMIIQLFHMEFRSGLIRQDFGESITSTEQIDFLTTPAVCKLKNKRKT